MQDPELRIALIECAAREKGYKVLRDGAGERVQLVVPSNSRSGSDTALAGPMTFSLTLAQAEAFLGTEERRDRADR
jgi:hypothetical protein